LRQAIIALGTSIALHHPDFAAYKRRLVDAGKKPIVATIAVGHRAHRLAFAMLRSQQPYQPERWQDSVDANMGGAGPSRPPARRPKRRNRPAH
jgi:hypothetical protein